MSIRLRKDGEHIFDQLVENHRSRLRANKAEQHRYLQMIVNMITHEEKVLQLIDKQNNRSLMDRILNKQYIKSEDLIQFFVGASVRISAAILMMRDLVPNTNSDLNDYLLDSSVINREYSEITDYSQKIIFIKDLIIRIKRGYSSLVL
jgi:hypothetical protein